MLRGGAAAHAQALEIGHDRVFLGLALELSGRGGDDKYDKIEYLREMKAGILKTRCCVCRNLVKMWRSFL